MDEATRRLLDQAAGKKASKEFRRVRFYVEIDTSEELIAYLDQQSDAVLQKIQRDAGERGREYAARLQPFRDEATILAMMRMGLELGSDAVTRLGIDCHVRLGKSALDGSDIVAVHDGGQFSIRISDVMFTR